MTLRELLDSSEPCRFFRFGVGSMLECYRVCGLSTPNNRLDKIRRGLISGIKIRRWFYADGWKPGQETLTTYDLSRPIELVDA